LVIALDTNVLVRFLVRDDETQSRAAERVLTRARQSGTHLYISDIVFCELAWVLRGRYRLARDEIAGAIDAILRTELIVVDDIALITRALSAFRSGSADFADYLIGELAHRADASEVITFDRALKGASGIRVL